MGGKATENMGLLRIKGNPYLGFKKKILTRYQNREGLWEEGIVKRLLLQMICDWNNLYSLYSAIECKMENL